MLEQKSTKETKKTGVSSLGKHLDHDVVTVNLLSDTGASSGTDPATGHPSGDLLWAITQANANPNTAGSVINFDPTVFGTAQTITLSRTLELSETGGGRWSTALSPTTRVVVGAGS